jgi:hypothetical protein
LTLDSIGLAGLSGGVQVEQFSLIVERPRRARRKMLSLSMARLDGDVDCCRAAESLCILTCSVRTEFEGRIVEIRTETRIVVLASISPDDERRAAPRSDGVTAAARTEYTRVDRS